LTQSAPKQQAPVMVCEPSEDCDGIWGDDDDCTSSGCLDCREGERISREHWNRVHPHIGSATA
jgi:hypothetical protein